MAFGRFGQRPEIDFNRMNNVFGPPTREFQDVAAMQPPPPPDIFGPPSPQFQQATTEPGYQDPMAPRGPNPQSPFSIPDVNMDYQVPENQSLRKFMEMAVPQRNNPNIVSKIGASMMSLGYKPEDVDKALYSRYYGELGDYQNQANNLLKSAQIEGQQNQYAGLNAYRQGQLDLGAGRLGVAQTNAQTAQQRAKNAEILAGMKNVRVKTGQGGQPDIWYDAKTGDRLMETPSGTMDPVTKYRMEQEGRMDVVEAQQEGATNRANTAAVTDLTIAGMPARPSSTEPSATQKQAQVELRAGELLRQNPEFGTKGWLTQNPETKQWEVAPIVEPGWTGYGGNGLTKEIRDMLVNYLNSGIAPSQAPQPPQQQAPGGQIPPVQPVPPGQGQGNTVNQTPIGGNNPELSGVNTGYSGYGAAPRPGSTVQLNRPPGDVNNPLGNQPPQQQPQEQKIKVTRNGVTNFVSQRNLARAQADGWKVAQ